MSSSSNSEDLIPYSGYNRHTGCHESDSEESEYDGSDYKLYGNRKKRYRKVSDGKKKKKQKTKDGKMVAEIGGVRPWDGGADANPVHPKQDPTQPWDNDPGIVWLKRQYAGKWERYMPNMTEMSVAWPGLEDMDGLRTEHLTDYWQSYLYNGPRDEDGILRST